MKLLWRGVDVVLEVLLIGQLGIHVMGELARSRNLPLVTRKRIQQDICSHLISSSSAVFWIGPLQMFVATGLGVGKSNNNCFHL